MKNPMRAWEQEESSLSERPLRRATGFRASYTAVASLDLGFTGAVFGWSAALGVDPAYVMAWFSAILAFLFGFRAIKQRTPRKNVAWGGLVLGTIAIVLGIVGFALRHREFSGEFPPSLFLAFGLLLLGVGGVFLFLLLSVSWIVLRIRGRSS